MRAIMYEKFQGPITLVNLEDPTPEKDGVIIELKASGLCLSDWHGWMGHDKDIELPHVPGHELAGVVVETGSEIRNFKKDDRVTVPFVSGCGKCPQCHTGNHQICDFQFQPGFTHFGSFAQYVAINYADTNLVHLPEEISFKAAASLGCRFATSFRGVVDQGKADQDDWVAIHGCGGVGLSAIMIAKALGANVIAIDIMDDKLKLAQAMGAVEIINSDKTGDVASTILELTNGGAHVSIDAIGHPDVLMNSISCLRKSGRHIQIGIMPSEAVHSKIPVDLIIARELEIAGSHGMQAYRYDEMLKMILDGRLSPDQLVTETLKLEDVIVHLPNMNTADSAGIKVITAFD
ncbi:MAG: zinc-dependent alcohol dehydrogenase family protein [Cyclobacteriaceae bacterium]